MLLKLLCNLISQICSRVCTLPLWRLSFNQGKIWYVQNIWGVAESRQNPSKSVKIGKLWEVGNSGMVWGKTPRGPIICKKIERLRKNGLRGQTGIDRIGGRLVCDHAPKYVGISVRYSARGNWRRYFAVKIYWRIKKGPASVLQTL